MMALKEFTSSRDFKDVNRITIIGAPGAGKTTLANILASVTNLPVYKLDDYFWQKGWMKPTEREREEVFRVLAANEQWIIDGTFVATMRATVERAEILVYLDVSLFVCLLRVMARDLRRLLGHREDMPIALRTEKKATLGLKFYISVLNFKKNYRDKIEAVINEFPYVKVLRLNESQRKALVIELGKSL